MAFWLSVIFLCSPDCTFVLGDTKFFTPSGCSEVTQYALGEIRKAGASAAGVCIKVDTKDLV